MNARPVPEWWAGLAAAELHIACDGAEHTLRWVDGDLLAVHHPDTDGEAALAALGGDLPACLALAATWHQHRSTPELVTLGRRPGEVGLQLEPLSQDMDVPALASARVRGLAPAAGARLTQVLRRRNQLRLLLAMPAPMIDRLVLTVLANCAAQWDDENFRADHGLRIGAGLSARAAPALRRFGAKLGYGPPEVGVSPVRHGSDGPAVAARVEQGKPLVVSAELPVSWLSNVWGRGVSEPGDEFVLAVLGGTPDGRELDVYVADWEPVGPITWEAVPVPATVVLDGDGFRQVHRG